jgi:hypothetical protein
MCLFEATGAEDVKRLNTGAKLPHLRECSTVHPERPVLDPWFVCPRELHFHFRCDAHSESGSGHERRIRANTPAAGRPQTADPAGRQGGFRLGPKH